MASRLTYPEDVRHEALVEVGAREDERRLAPGVARVYVHARQRQLVDHADEEPRALLVLPLRVVVPAERNTVRTFSKYVRSFSDVPQLPDTDTSWSLVINSHMLM